MLDDIRAMAVFAETVDAGSMSASARRLGMSPSAVSQTIRTLEAHAGITLLHRSTRKLSLSEAGERYYPHCKRLLEASRAGAESLQLARSAPHGELRIAAPVGFASHIGPALAPLLADAPQLRLRLLVNDAMIDLIDARIDIAIRVGQLSDSNWIARRLCELDTVLCAAPAYLARHGVPGAPADLAAHSWLALAHGPDSQAVSLALALHSGAGEQARALVQARVTSNNQSSLQQLCEHGLGIAHLVHADVAPALQRGALVRLLPGWRLPPMTAWAVTARRDAEAAKVRVALEHLQRHFATLPHAP